MSLNIPNLAGEDYHAVLGRLHKILSPQTYFEIGTSSGHSLALASCASVAVDPAFAVSGSTIGQKPMCCLYQMRSDAFFAAHDLSAIFGRPVDMAFLDGMHWAEVLLRDFINTERHCRRNSLIALHDCVPVHVQIADRDPEATHRIDDSDHRGWWTGDVWKTLLALKRYRPDLRIHTLDASLTGLVLVTNLDPASRVLDAAYPAILDWFRHLDLREYGLARLMADIDLQPTDRYVRPQDISSHFWL